MEVSFLQLRVNTDFEGESNVLGLLLVYQPLLFGFDISLLVRVVLAALLEDLLHEVFRVLQPIDAILDYDEVLDAMALILVLVLLLDGISQAGLALIHIHLLIEREQYQNDDLGIFGRDLAPFLKALDLIQDRILLRRPVK